MAVTLLGSSAVAKLLDGLGRVAIANQASPDDDIAIVGFAIVRHQADGSVQQDVAVDLELGGDQSVNVEAIPPLPDAPEAIEVALRLRIGGLAEIVDVYAVSRPAAGSDGQVEVGVKATGEELVDGEQAVPGFPEFAVYALPPG